MITTQPQMIMTYLRETRFLDATWLLKKHLFVKKPGFYVLPPDP
jgi:hypothetical protein